MEMSVQQADQDLFIDELVKNFTDESKNTCIRTIDRKHQKLRLMSYPMAYYFLTNIGIRDGNLPPNEAVSLALNMIKYYKPSSVTEEEIQKDEYNYAYTRLEFKRLFVQYLVVCCNIDPLEAMKRNEADRFWQRFYSEDESSALTLPVLYGSVNEVEKAKEIQRKQIEDLIILKNYIKSRIEPLNRKYVEEACTNETDKETSWLDYQRKIEIVIAHINSIINRQLAKDWLATDSLFKYTVQWLEQILVMIMKEIDEVKVAEINQPLSYSINYPAIFCDQEQALKMDTDRETSINENFKQRLARTYLNNVEVIEPVLVEFCLVMMGMDVGGMEAPQAHKLARKAINSWSCKPQFRFNKVYTKKELYTICRNYLGHCCNCYSPRILERLTKFWRALFPNTGQFFGYLPDLIGTPDQIKQAESIRETQIEGLLELQEFVKDTTGQAENLFTDLCKELQSSLTIDISVHLNAIIVREEAKDWLNTSLVVYDPNWLYEEIDKLWKAAKDDWQEKISAMQVSEPKIFNQPAEATVKNTTALENTKHIKLSVQAYEINILMLGKLRGQVKVIRAAKDDGITLEPNEHIDLNLFEFAVQENRLMCLEAMKNLVRAGYFELGSIAIEPKEQPNNSTITIKTYNITDKGRDAPILSPILGPQQTGNSAQ